MSTARRRKQRGITMVIAMILVVILLVVALTVLAEALNSSASAGGVQSKSYAFNAAEAALNKEIGVLDAGPPTPAPGTCSSLASPVNGITPTGCIQAIAQTSATTAPDPATNQTISVPIGYAYVTGSVTGALQHRTYAEALVFQITGPTLPPAGMNGENDIVDSWNFKTVINADVHANDAIYINGSPASANGSTYGYNINQLTVTCPCPPHGQFTKPQATQVIFPSPSQMTLFKTAAKEAAMGGTPLTAAEAVSTCTGATGCSGNVYVDGDLNLTSGITFSGNGTDYINGNVTISGNSGFIQNVNNNTIVISGTLSITGQSFYINPTNGGQLIVYATDSSTCQGPQPNTSASGCALNMAGNSEPSGLIYVPFGSAILAGNGNGLGSVDAGTTPNQSGGVIYLYGGGSGGGFTAVPTSPPTLASHLWKITSYWEY